MMKRNLPRQMFDSPINRRQFLKTSAVTLGSLYGLNYLNPPTANAAGEVNFLTVSHFVPAADIELKRQAAAFSKEKGIRVTIEAIGIMGYAPKLASQAHAKLGHDIVGLGAADPKLYKDLLSDVSDLAEELGKTHGGWYEFAKDVGMEDGRWTAIPYNYSAWPLVVRSDLLKDVGENKIDTYDDLLRVGRKLKARGNPVGFALSHCVDSLVFTGCILWAFGGRGVAEDSKTVVIDSAETARALECMRKLYVEAMEPEVLSWDETSNNRFILSGKGSITMNPISLYWMAKVKKMMLGDKPIAELLDHYLPPRGPAGRVSIGSVANVGIWNFSRNVAGAKDFLRYHFSRENFNNWIKTGDGYNMPFLKEFEKNPVWDSDPKYAFAKGYGQTMRITGWPGKPTLYNQIVLDLFIIPDMFASAASGKRSVPEAIKWAEREMKLIYAGGKKVEPKKG